MKRYLKLSLFTLIFIFMFSMIPNIAGMGTASVSLQYPSVIAVNDYIYVNGVVEEQNKREIFADIPIVPLDVKYMIGDAVSQGDVIATVDINKTKLAILDMAEAVSKIPKEYVELMGSLNISSELLSGVIPTEITAQKSGKITNMAMVEGSVAYPKLPLCTISDTENLRINMNVNELDCGRISEGDAVSFKATATKDDVYHGRVTRVFPAAQTAIMGTEKQTVLGFYVTPDESYKSLKPGFTVNGVVKKGEAKSCLTVPYEAVGQDEYNREFLYTAKNGRAERVYIETGTEFKNAVEVKRGITKDDIIVKNAGAVKKDGQHIRAEG